MTETIEVQDPYTSYVNVKIVDLWFDVYLLELKTNNQTKAKELADKAVKDFKDFLQGV